MKRDQLKFLFIIFVLLISSQVGLISDDCPCNDQLDNPYPEGCTTILVGKKASVDGSVMALQTADCGICDFTWHLIPAKDHAEGTMRKIYHINQMKTWPPEQGGKWIKYVEGDTGLEIPQVSHTYAYHFGIFGHMNEHQLSIQESTIGCRKKLRNNTPSAKMDITTLTRLAMERCKTARSAIKLMGEMSTKYGYGFHDGGEMLAISDPDEIWIFEIMPVGPLWTQKSEKPGAVWCAQRVPNNHVSFCPNESRIGEINLKKKKYFMASSNVVSLAVKKKYYDPESGKPFSWKHAYSPSIGSPQSTSGRRGRLWRLLCLVAPSKQFDPNTETMDFPFSVKPDKKISLQDMMSMSRDKYQNSQFDPAVGLKGGPFGNPNYFNGFRKDKERYFGSRSISVNNVEYTSLTQCRSWLPDPVGGVNWIALGAQDTSCYIPFYAGISAMPKSMTIGDHYEFNRDSARWAFDTVDFHTQVVYSYAIKDVKTAQEKWEKWGMQQLAVIDQAAADLYKKNPKSAIDYITDFCMNHTQNVVNAWWELGNQLLVKYNHFRIYNSKTRKPGRIKYPDWWRDEVIKYHDLKPQPTKKK